MRSSNLDEHYDIRDLVKFIMQFYVVGIHLIKICFPQLHEHSPCTVLRELVV